VHIAFLGCGFITGVHSRHLKALRDDVVRSYASRHGSKAEACRRRYLGAASYDSYSAAIEDPAVDAVVIAVPPRFHLDLTLLSGAFRAGSGGGVEGALISPIVHLHRHQQSRRPGARGRAVHGRRQSKVLKIEPVL